MTLPTIKFNNATGSDTAASGYGPATAVSGANASFNATAVVTVAGSNLSTISAGDLFWGQTTGNRQNSIIVSVDDTLDTITCTDTFTATESSINWGVGGKRKTIGNTHSVKIFNTNNVKRDGLFRLKTRNPSARPLRSRPPLMLSPEILSSKAIQRLTVRSSRKRRMRRTSAASVTRLGAW